MLKITTRSIIVLIVGAMIVVYLFWAMQASKSRAKAGSTDACVTMTVQSGLLAPSEAAIQCSK